MPVSHLVVAPEPSGPAVPGRRGGPRRLWGWAAGRGLGVKLAQPAASRVAGALAVVALAVGIVSGGAVRLTGSGLGCSDWPACTRTSIVAPLQYHAWVEFGNRLVNVLITLAVASCVAAALWRRPRRRDLVHLSLGLVGGILAEVVLGGETVLNKLAPPFVMGHMLLALVLLGTAVVFFHRANEAEEPLATRPGQARPARLVWRVGGPQRAAATAMVALTALVVTLGTVVTGTGPHAGAPSVPRFGFSLHSVAQLHANSVEVLLALTVGTLWWLHRSGAPAPVLRRAEAVLAVLVAQAAVGYTQYFTGDPVLLVGFHLAGATSVVVAMVAFYLGLYSREPSRTVQTGGEEHTAQPLVKALGR